MSHNDHMDDSETGAEEPLPLQEQLLMMATARREHDREQEEYHRAQQATELIQNQSSTAAAQAILGSIADPETRDRLIKLKEKEDAARQKELERENAMLASSLIGGDPCVCCVAKGRKPPRPADPAYGHMCRPCFYARNKKNLRGLSDQERYEAKKRNKEDKRQRDEAKAQEQELLIAAAQKKRTTMLQKKRLKTLLFAPVPPVRPIPTTPPKVVFARPAPEARALAPAMYAAPAPVPAICNNNNNNRSAADADANSDSLTFVACPECNNAVEKVPANQCNFCGDHACPRCRDAHLSRVHPNAAAPPMLEGSSVRPALPAPISSDSGDGDLGIDLHKLNTADQREEELDALMEELDSDYQDDDQDNGNDDMSVSSQDEEDDEEDDSFVVPDHAPLETFNEQSDAMDIGNSADDANGDDHGNVCVACLEAADPSNATKCSSCGETLHHWAECIRDHSCPGVDSINIVD